MFLILVFVFLIVPFIEVALFIAVGSEIGIVPTIGLCLASAVAGALLVRHQGLTTLARIRAELRHGQVPTADLAEGAAIIAAGGLLIMPGFFTDTIGFVLLVPAARRAILRTFTNYLAKRFIARGGGRPRRYGAGHNTDGSIIIEGEAEDVTTEKTIDKRSPWER